MSNQIVLVSDDSDFFEFIKLKLELRKSDKLITLSFDEVPSRIDCLQTSVLIVNGENSNQKTVELLGLFDSSVPIIVTAYNDDENFKKKCYRAGMLDFIPLLTPDAEFRARMLPALNLLSVIKKNAQYRSILVKNKLISKNNEVFINYESVIDEVLFELKRHPSEAVFAAISTDDKDKYLINPNVIETFLLCNLRKNDILMKFAHNKYYLIMFNTDVKSAKKHWDKITKNFAHKMYAGFVQISNQNRQQITNHALINLQEAIGKKQPSEIDIKINPDNVNFKMRRNMLAERMEILINPVFYRIQQKYINKLSGVKVEQDYSNGAGYFNIIGKHFSSAFKINCPGFSKININITVSKESEIIDSKRFSFASDEFDEGILEDLLEQYIKDIKTQYSR